MNNTGASFEILVDGHCRSYRDVKEAAIEAAKFLKERNAMSEVSVRDIRDKSIVFLLEKGTAKK